MISVLESSKAQRERVKVLGMALGFVNESLPDIALYLGRHGKAIRHGLSETLRRAADNSVHKGASGRIGIISFSLGSRIVVDTLATLAGSSRASFASTR